MPSFFHALNLTPFLLPVSKITASDERHHRILRTREED